MLVAMARRATRRQGPPTAERRIHFFRAVLPYSNGGPPPTLDIAPVLRHVDTLPCAIDQRYWLQTDGNVLCAWIDECKPTAHMRLAMIRRTGLPLLEEAGSLSPLLIADTAGLYEPIHVCFFPNNLVGVEYNAYGPRSSRISAYLYRIAPTVCPSFELEPLIRRDVMEQLRRLQRLRVMDLKIRASYAQLVAEADADLGAAFDAARRFSETDIVHLEFRPEPYQRRRWLGGRALPAVLDLAQRADLRENALAFMVEGLDRESQSVETIDILKGHLVSTKRIVRLDARSRALDPEATYTAIEEAYQDMLPDLETAASATALQR